MTTYTMLDAMMASHTEPLPIEKRMFQLQVMWDALESLQTAPAPTKDDWKAVASAINMMEALRDLGAVEDPENLIDDAKQAMGNAGIRSLNGKPIRLDGRGLTLIKGVLEDYCDALEALPARTVISAHRYAEKRIGAILRGKRRTTDVSVK